MSVQNVFVGDVALVELLRSGTTQAPAHVLDELDRRGHITLGGGCMTLTAAGRERAEKLKDRENDLRAMHANGGKVCMVGQPAITGARAGGAPANSFRW